MSEDEEVFIFPFERGEILTKINRLSSLHKLKISHQRISKLIEKMEEEVSHFTNHPRGPREENNQNHTKKTLQVLKRQKTHQEEKYHSWKKKSNVILKIQNDDKISYDTH